MYIFWLLFFGYSEESKAYKLYDPVAKKVIVSRDVQFVENEAWDGSIEKIVKIVGGFTQDDMEEEVVQTLSTTKVAVPSTPGTSTQVTIQSIVPLLSLL